MRVITKSNAISFTKVPLKASYKPRDQYNINGDPHPMLPCILYASKVDRYSCYDTTIALAKTGFSALPGSCQFCELGKSQSRTLGQNLVCPSRRGARGIPSQRGSVWSKSQSHQFGGPVVTLSWLNRDSNSTPDSRPSVIAFRS